VKFIPHVLAVHVRVWHSVSVPGHCEAVLHWTHWPEPLQTCPPFWLHGELRGAIGLLGTPAVQTSEVH